jgi:hypothetical protein
MDLNLEASEANAKLKLRQAEEALWQHFVACVKADLGPELSQWLDDTLPDDWRVTTEKVIVKLKRPKSSEIAVQYVRDRRAGDRYLRWENYPWQGRGREQTSGKYAVVRYELDEPHPDEAAVKPTDEDEWYVGNDIENAYIVAEEYAREREELEDQARELLAEARARLRRIREGR